MPVNRKVLRWAGLAGCLISTAVSADEAQDWLSRMTEASRELSFRGAFAYERSGSFTTHQIWRRAGSDGVTERLVQSDGPVQEWLRRDGRLVCSSTAGTGLNPHEASQPIDELELLLTSYAPRVIGTTRVAARPVTVLAVEPRDVHRYAYELYLDSDTGLLLKSLMLGERGVLMERFQFASLEVGSVPDDLLETTTDCTRIEQAQAASGDLGDAWRPAWVPQGFQLQSETSETAKGASTPTVSRTYTDGLTRFSLFVEKLDGMQRAEDVRAQIGPTVAVSRKLTMPEETVLATLVGEIPSATAERVIASLLPMHTEAQQ
ncbi:sigma E regulatory protein, MucB/RseB [Halopseudomonas xinjiangensis]|uniref:Sigma E regulatory protein, MucB/RseB n=1 Tax=Halopseudomonas xinjiangensis TaxID=487184 RepID=A0A1H1V7P5_9GAMM|nr:MucB/RseB C-terminal domain-containing protein [Halopseudomonas xinjiangensis]SDS80501.1 sigma E regulatory protein, MucB/RseB [Halopseudomonas xinjiangensis]